MLHRSSVPIFDNVASMIADLGYLLFLVRSTEVWGVKSRVSGDFDPERRDQAWKTCQKLVSFLHCDSFVPGDPVPTLGISLDAADKLGLEAWNDLTLNNDHQTLLRAATRRGSNSNSPPGILS